MKSMRLSIGIFMLVFVGLATSLQAQVIEFDPTGVWVNTDGVLRSRDKIDKKFLADIKRRARVKINDKNYAYISLPKVFAESQKLIEAGKPLPDDIKFLKGMVQLEYVFVYPDTKDIVIAGPTEELDHTAAQRPVGKVTGRPVLQLEDLVVAMRIANARFGIGVKIELLPEASDRMLKVFNKNKSLAKTNRKKMAMLMAEEGGMQPVKYLHMKGNTRLANVFVEADYVMKRLAIGLDRSPVSSVRSYVSQLRPTETAQHRFWLELNDRAIGESHDGMIFEFKGEPIRISTAPQGLISHGMSKPSKAAQRFAELSSKHMEELSRHILSFADLSNLADLCIVGALIANDKLDTKVGWDRAWVLKKFPVQEYITIKGAPTLVNSYGRASGINFTAGGVLLYPVQAMKKRESLDNEEVKIPTKHVTVKSWHHDEELKATSEEKK